MTHKTPQLAKRRGILFILSAPSGAGKTTLINGLRSVHPDIKLSVSCTTRARRSGEVNGRDYRFLTAQQFAAMKARKEFAEWAKVHGFLYATPRKPLDRSIATGTDMVLDIDVQGARQIKRIYPQAVSVFLLPPSWRELQQRLVLRGTDGSTTIRRRLTAARREIREIIKYDYYVVNRDVTRAVEMLKSIVEAERSKTARVRQWRIDLLRQIQNKS
ncbi:MAG TPA: guanylate kinase [Methylomirabilota bacterium]|nr:guanylate kinase [Methylomirabilota bacterium]